MDDAYSKKTKAKKQITKLSRLSALIWVLFGSVAYLIPQYVHSYEQQYDMSSIRDGTERLNERIWQLKDRLREYPDDDDAREELNMLLRQRKSIYMQLDNQGFGGTYPRYDEEPQ